MLRLSKKFNKQAGISLLEVMLSLSIIAIILVMATRYFFVASNSSNVNKIRNQIGTVVSAIQQYRNQNSNYAGLTNIGILITQGFIAKTADVNTKDGTFSNSWTNLITVAPGSGNTTAVISTTLPTVADCLALKSGYSVEQTVTCTPKDLANSGTSVFSLTISS